MRKVGGVAHATPPIHISITFLYALLKAMITARMDELKAITFCPQHPPSHSHGCRGQTHLNLRQVSSSRTPVARWTRRQPNRSAGYVRHAESRAESAQTSRGWLGGEDTRAGIMIRLPSHSTSVEASSRCEPSNAMGATCEIRRGWKSRAGGANRRSADHDSTKIT